MSVKKCPFMSCLIFKTESFPLNGSNDQLTVIHDGALATSFSDNLEFYPLNKGNNPTDEVFAYYPDCIQDKCMLWDQYNDECGAKASDILNHVHTSHWHGRGHDCSDKESNCGTTSNGFGIPFASTLIAEYMGSEDLDKNNAIYGKDFIIDNEDPDKPKMLQSIEESPDWVDPVKKVFWEDLVSWAKSGGDDPLIVATIIAEFIESEDLDENGSIYGIDFMIDNEDPDKPEKLTEMENSSNNWVDNNNKISWSDYISWINGGANPL